MDPHAVLGLEPGASPEEIQRAYRGLAKRFHPDTAGAGEGELMASINAAHDMLRDGITAQAPAEARPPSAAERVRAGHWLDDAVRRVVAGELLTVLEPGEPVEEVLLTATRDSHDVQLVLTDRRLLWLRDDAILGRVRYLRFRDVTGVAVREGRRWRRGGELRVRSAAGRELRFFDLRPDVLGRLARAVEVGSVP